MKNRTKILMVSTFGILVISIFPSVLAGPPAFFRDEDFPWWNNLAMPFFAGYWDVDPEGNFYYVYADWWTFDPSDELHFRIGCARSIQEKEDDAWPGTPWRYRLWINDEEIKMQRYASPLDNEIFHPAMAQLWYVFFEPNYFDPEQEYELRWEFWVKNPYQGDGLNYWRIYVDYWGYWDPPGTVASFEYTLHFH